MSVVDAGSGSPNIVEARDICRRYGEGEVAVDALAGVDVSFPSGTIRRDHGALGVWQVDA